MYSCNICGAQFQYRCRLIQHMNKKNPCVKPEAVNTEQQCTYCLLPFKRVSKHEPTCKQRYDSVRVMEITLGIGVSAPETETSCRFCNKQFSRANNLQVHYRTCKKKMDYANMLQGMMQKHARGESSSTNINNTNNGIININVNTPLPFGKENRDYITKETVMRLWNRCNKSPEKFVSKLIAYIHTNPSHPENHNVIYSNARSSHAKVFNGDSYELQYVDEIIAQASSNSLDHMMGELYDNSSTKAAIGRIMDNCESVETDVNTKREMIRQARLALYNSCPKLKRTQVAEALPMPDVELLEYN